MIIITVIYKFWGSFGNVADGSRESGPISVSVTAVR